MKKKYLSIILIITVLLSLPLLSACSVERDPVTTYELWLDFTDDGVDCVQRLTFVNSTAYEFSELKLNVYANAFDSKKPLPCTSQEQSQAYPNGVSFGEFDLRDTYGDFESYDFDFDANLITVALATPLLPAQSVVLEFVYSLTLPNTTLRYGFNERGVSLTGFYPQLCAIVDGEWYYDEFSAIGDPYFADVADYEVTFNLPSGCEYVSSGTSQTNEVDGETFVTAKARDIRDFALIISPELAKTSEVYNGVSLSYLGSNADTLTYAKRALDVYSALFGKYAYDSLAIADMPFVAGGMEYGTLCVINEEIQGSEYEEVVAHEIAHQWWYSQVGSNNLVSAWQDEGLTNYSTYLYFVQIGNFDYAELMLSSAYSQYQRFCDIQNSVGEPAQGKLGGRLADFPSSYYYTNLTYNKTLIMWKYAQDALGKDNLVKALSVYAKTYTFAIADEDDLWSTLDSSIPDASALIKSFILSQ